MGNTIALIRDLSSRNEVNTLGSAAKESGIQYIMESPDIVLEKHHIRLELKSAYSTVRLNSEIPTTVKCLVSLKSEDDELQEGKILRYNNVDLVCVIDTSGSMAGEKLRLVKKSLDYVIDQLGKGDRMSLITFSGEAKVQCELVADYRLLKQNVQKLTSNGSTNIRSGLEQAYKIITKNTNSSKVQCIWLLSDGQDKFHSQLVEEHINANVRRNSAFTIHTIGFGNDHDSKLMKNIAKARGGKFIFIEKEEELNKAMANLLGGAFSAIAKKAVIRVECVANGILREAKISKAYGDFKRHGESGAYQYQVVQYRAGSSNCYVFQVELPPAQINGNYGGKHQLLRATAAITRLDDVSPLELKETLELALLSPNDVLRKQLPDQEVTENFARVRVVEIMRGCVDLLERRRYEEIPALLDQAAPLLDQAPQSDKIKQLRDDVAEIRRRIQQQDYTGGYRYTCGQERFHGERYYSVGQERFQSIVSRQHVQFKERDWY